MNTPGPAAPVANRDWIPGRNEIHIWQVSLDIPDQDLVGLLPYLSEAEQQRAARFHFARDRRRFQVAHGVLNMLLSGILSADPTGLVFQLNPYGKPALGGELSRTGLSFNISHSQSVSLIGVGFHREVGVDVEWMRPGLQEDGIAERFFSPQEVTALRQLPGDLQRVGFFNCWTRKEAYIKAIGMGLSLPLDAFDVSLAPGEPPALLNTYHDPLDRDRWLMREVDLGPDYRAAVCVEGKDWELVLRNWA